MTTSPTVLAKARRYLVEGRLLICSMRDGKVFATVQGSASEPYTLGQTAAGRHWCTCPARATACAHVVALALVVGTPDQRRAALAEEGEES